jgi:hypothetical protein
LVCDPEPPIRICAGGGSWVARTTAFATGALSGPVTTPAMPPALTTMSWETWGWSGTSIFTEERLM